MSYSDWSWKPDKEEAPKKTFYKKVKKVKKKRNKKPKLYADYKDSFYTTKEWRELRYDFLKSQKAQCACCGRSPKKHGVVIHVDHIKPRSKYPELELRMINLQILCEDCNLGKSNQDETDWR